jgi:hypothetical protein
MDIFAQFPLELVTLTWPNPPTAIDDNVDSIQTVNGVSYLVEVWVGLVSPTVDPLTFVPGAAATPFSSNYNITQLNTVVPDFPAGLLGNNIDTVAIATQDGATGAWDVTSYQAIVLELGNYTQTAVAPGGDFDAIPNLAAPTETEEYSYTSGGITYNFPIEYAQYIWVDLGPEPTGAVTISDKTEAATIPITVSGSTLTAQTNNPAVYQIHFDDTNASPSPTVSYTASYSARNSRNIPVSLTAAQQSALSSLGFSASIDPNNTQVDWSFNSQYTPQTSQSSPGSRYLDPLAGYNVTVTENIVVSDPAGGSDTSTVTLNVTGAPSVTELAELSYDAYNIGTPFNIARFTAFNVQILPDGFSATAYKSADGSQVVVAFRGTDFDFSPSGVKNLLADSSFVTGVATPTLTTYFNHATAFLQSVKSTNPNANITLTGHSLGGAAAEYLGKAAGLTAIGFDAVGAGNVSFSGLSSVGTMGTSSDWENYRLYGDQVSLDGTPIGAQYTVANLDGSDNPLRALEYHDMETLALQLAGGVVPTAGASDPFFYSPLVNAIAPPILARFQSKSIFSITFDALSNAAISYIDPTAGYSFLYEQSANSPYMSSITLPELSGVSNYILQSESNGIWSIAQTVGPDVAQSLGSNTTAVKFEPLDGSGDVVQIPEAFFFGASFQSSGPVTATLTEQSEVADDFDGDATADVLLQSGSNDVVDWAMQNGAYAGNYPIGNSSGYQIVGSGNFNNGNRADILLADGSGNLLDCIMETDSLAVNIIVTGVPSGWNVVGTGDFNDDGTSDILLKNGGSLTDFLINNSAVSGSNTITTGLPAGWNVVGTGDFNGDGTSDILLQNGSSITDWLMNNGSLSSSNAITTGLPAGWKVVGTGDFNGDGTSDILLQNGGSIVDWLMNNGSLSSSTAITTGLPAGWNVVGTGDYNGDGTSDILLQNGGSVTDWLINNGSLSSSNSITTNLPPGWNALHV